MNTNIQYVYTENSTSSGLLDGGVAVVVTRGNQNFPEAVKTIGEDGEVYASLVPMRKKIGVLKEAVR